MEELIKLTDLDIALNEAVYRYFLDNENPNGWLRGSQESNFRDLIAITRMTGLSLAGSSIMDVGCGTGDLYGFLKERGHKGNYIGIDIFSKVIDLAKAKYPNGEFIIADILNPEFQSKCDFAFASGAFSARLETDNYDFLEAMLSMRMISRLGVAFNFLPEQEVDCASELFLYDSKRVTEICKKIAPADSVILQTAENQRCMFVYMVNKTLM